ncbi:hypothetical protein GCM10012284_46020 [Mangrovihabitans endophyticus]|uniref:SGNH hydrolase-type esterase domain-containing protein n=1 Tax=Mangrovihabitans endophyticus TaxID=1751298 RepID=A0A8J3C2N5_9ACTN|nr:hypothetical protein GCM10012284_46020 [Mangrovihabitans endophyticus]
MVAALSAGAVTATVVITLAATAPAAPRHVASGAGPVAVTARPDASAAGTKRTPARGAGRPVRIMPLGDSITAGIGTATYDSYRRDLYDRLVAAGVDVDFVGSQHAGTGADNDHEGHSGWTIARIAGNVDGWLRRYRPDVVLLHLGTNDMRSDQRARGAQDRFAVLIRRIRHQVPGAQIMVAKLIGSSKEANQRRIDTFNDALTDIVRAAGARVHLVDQSSVHGLSMRDTLHPNDYGAAQMAWNWYRALEPVLNHGIGRWPAGVDPYQARRAYLCELTATKPRDGYVPVVECDWWHRSRSDRPWVRG